MYRNYIMYNRTCLYIHNVLYYIYYSCTKTTCTIENAYTYIMYYSIYIPNVFMCMCMCVGGTCGCMCIQCDYIHVIGTNYIVTFFVQCYILLS